LKCIVIAPSSTDKRGPCPGLNAAANHGFIPRNGIVNTGQGKFALYLNLNEPLLIITEAVSGVGEAFAFGPLITTVLSFVGVALTGDLGMNPHKLALDGDTNFSFS